MRKHLLYIHKRVSCVYTRDACVVTQAVSCVDTLPIWKPPGPYGPGRQVAEFEAPGGRRHPAHLAIQPPGTFSSMVHLALSFARSEYGGRL